MAMTFKIVFAGGLQAGVDAEQVKGLLVERFRMPRQKVEQIFAAGRVILKKGLTDAQAMAYFRKLTEVGMVVEKHAETAETAAPAAASPAPVEADGGYRIVFGGGLLDGFAREAVMEAARLRLNLDDKQLRAVFSGRELGLKRGLDLTGARKYLDLLRTLGMEVWCDPALPPAPPEPVIVAPSPPPAAESPGELEAAEQRMMETAFWSDPTAQQNELDEVDQRLLDAMSMDFALPVGDGLPSDGPPGLTGTDLGNASRHLAETMLNGDALRMYEREIAEAEARGGAADEMPPLPVDAPSLDRYGQPTAGPAEDEYAVKKTIVVVPLPRVQEPVAPPPPEAVVPAPTPAPAPVEVAEPTPAARGGGKAGGTVMRLLIVVGGLMLLAVVAWLASGR